MFNSKKIRDSFFGLAGLRQTDNPDYPILSDKLLYTGTNLLINHPLLSIENIDLSSKNFSKFNYSTWNILTSYILANRIKYNGIVYESLIAPNVGNQPDTSPAAWKVVNLLSLYLEDIFESASDDLIGEVANKKKLNKTTKTLLQNFRLSDSSGSFNDLIVNESDLVGVQITLKRNQNILAVINKVGLQLTQANPAMSLYLYHSSQYTPISTILINHTNIISFQWHLTDIKLNYMSGEYDAGGVFFLMYDQSTLVGQAIKKTINFNEQPCGSCNYSHAQNFNVYSQFVEIKTCKVKSADRNGINLWDISKTQYIPDNNYGLNFDITIKCDLTDFIISQRDIFAYAYRDMVQLKLLKNLMHSTRQNFIAGKLSDSSKSDSIVRAELQDSKLGGMGLQEKLEKQIESLDFEISDLDSVCMPCNNKSGIRLKTAGLAR